MQDFISGIFAFSKAVSDFNIRIVLMLLIPLTRTRVFKFCNRPLSVVFAPIVIWWRHKPDVAKADNAHYFASCRNRAGLYGRGNYTKFPIVKTAEVYSIEIEELMKDRLRTEPNFFMGTREEVIAHIKNVKNEDFDNALTMAHYRITGLQNNVEDFANSLANPQTAFRHWLATQVANGKIIGVDGYVFVQRSPDAPMKNCEVGDFLYKYYDSFESARKLDLHESYRNVDLLAKHLLGGILKESLGVGSKFQFEEINTKIRDRHNAATTTIECHPVIASEPVIPNDKIVAAGSYDKLEHSAEEQEVRDQLEDSIVAALGLQAYITQVDTKVNIVNATVNVPEASLFDKMDIEQVNSSLLAAADYFIDNKVTDLTPFTLDEIKAGSKAPSAFSQLVASNHLHIGKTVEGDSLSDEGKPLARVRSINHPEDYGVKPIATENVKDGNFLEVKDIKRLNSTMRRSKPSVSGRKPS